MLIRVATVDGNETEASQVLADKLEECGVKAKLYGEEKARMGLVAEIPGAYKGQTLMLNGHLDTVPFGDLKKWHNPPISGKITGNRLYGRGSYDMKGGVAALTLAALDILRDDCEFSGKILLAFTYDEEKRHQGVKTLLKRRTANACIIGEPSRMKLNIGYRGVYRVELESKGVTAHTGNLRGQGVNAVTNMARMLLALERTRFTHRHHRLFPRPNITPGTMISAGTAGNIIPDNCKAVVDCRLSYGQTDRTAHADITRTLSGLVEDNPTLRYGLHGISYVPYFITKEDDSIARAVANAATEVIGRKPDIRVSGGASDGNFTSKRGIPTVIFGPSGGNIHSENEYVELRSLHRCRRIYKDAVSSYLG